MGMNVFVSTPIIALDLFMELLLHSIEPLRVCLPHSYRLSLTAHLRWVLICAFLRPCRFLVSCVCCLDTQQRIEFVWHTNEANIFGWVCKRCAFFQSSSDLFEYFATD